MRSFQPLLAVWPLLSSLLLTASAGSLQVHDKSFVPDHTLYVTAGNYTINCQSRYSAIINGSSPGPTLYLTEGQVSWVRVWNNMTDQNLTMHWHGLSQRTAPFSDGTPQISQWPIPPGHFFDYEIRPEVGDAGSYFYHSHIDFQAVTAIGPLIVKRCGKELYEYEKDILLSLTDYYSKTDAQVVTGLLANPFAWPGETNALLINGQSGNASLSNATDKSCAPHVIKVKPSTSYRIRFIGTTAISLVTLGIEGHTNLSIIEADGADTKPFSVDHLQVASGQRFSVLLTTKSEEEIKAANKSSFWIRYENRERPANVSGYALLSYDIPGSELPKDLPSSPPVTLPQKVYDWLEYSLEPHNASADPFPASATRTVRIVVHQKGTYVNNTFESTLEWQQNGDVWQPSRVAVPYLVQIYVDGEAAIPDYDAAIQNGGWDPKNLAFPAKLGEIIDVVWESNNLPTGGFDIHPFHAHGRHYWDLGSGNGTYDAAANDKKLQGYSPVKRDTTMLYRYETSGPLNTTAGWRAWRLRADEAGAFMIHCHILQHQIMGMSTAWVFGNASQITQDYPEPYISGYLQYGGSAVGNSTYDPLVLHNWGGKPGSCTK